MKVDKEGSKRKKESPSAEKRSFVPILLPGEYFFLRQDASRKKTFVASKIRKIRRRQKKNRSPGKIKVRKI